MKRYKKLKTQFPKLNGGAIEVENKMTEDPQGEWVKWEDVEELLGKLGHEASTAGFHSRIKLLEEREDLTRKALFKALDDMCRDYIRTHDDRPDDLKCNCEEMAKLTAPGMIMEHWWICPIHGYKKR